MNIWMLIALIAGAIQVTGLVVLIRCAKVAPEGYEADDGFRLSTPSQPQKFAAPKLVVGSGDLKHAA